VFCRMSCCSSLGMRHTYGSKSAVCLPSLPGWNPGRPCKTARSSRWANPESNYTMLHSNDTSLHVTTSIVTREQRLSGTHCKDSQSALCSLQAWQQKLFDHLVHLFMRLSPSPYGHMQSTTQYTALCQPCRASAHRQRIPVNVQSVYGQCTDTME